MISDADNYSVVFPEHATREDKALILSGAVFIDYMYFETNGNQNK